MRPSATTHPGEPPPRPATAPAGPDLESVRAARDRIYPAVHRTPILGSTFLGAIHGSRVWMKAESLQRAGSFKIRGALNTLLSARACGRLPEAGVLSYSSGNHGQAVALAARILGVRSRIVVPEDVLGVKRAAMEGYGAEVIPCGRTSEDRRLRALEIAAETGALVVPPYDHPDIISGQGTVALEILEDLGDLDAILVPVGGGGLISGIATAAKALRPRVLVIGAEPEAGDDFRRSIAEGTRVRIPAPQTIADGLRAVIPGELTFPIVERLVDRIWTASDDTIREAQRILLERAKLFVEPSGAAAVAAYLEHGRELESRSVAIVLSGGNAELSTLAAALRGTELSGRGDTGT